MGAGNIDPETACSRPHATAGFFAHKTPARPSVGESPPYGGSESLPQPRNSMPKKPSPTPIHNPAPPASPVAAATLGYLLGVLLVATPLHSQNTTVCPNDRHDLEGSSKTSYPLGRHNCRFQQLYSELAGQPWIQGHSYRRDALGSTATLQAYASEVTITLSRVIQHPKNIRPRFADNMGASATLVLDRSWIQFPTTSQSPSIPAPFEYTIPYRRPYLWAGSGTLAMDLTIFANRTAAGPNKNFAAKLDSQQLYALGRNLQPGYRSGRGCPAPGATRAAWCAFQLQHEGASLNLRIESHWGMPSGVGQPSDSVLLLSFDANPVAWPANSGCQIYGKPEICLPLAGQNSALGAMTITIPVGPPPPPLFQMHGQILSYNAHTAGVTLSDTSRLLVPPPGKGIVSSRLVHASDRNSPTGTISTTVPICEFY
jgi:hypothetical protein